MIDLATLPKKVTITNSTDKTVVFPYYWTYLDMSIQPKETIELVVNHSSDLYYFMMLNIEGISVDISDSGEIDPPDPEPGEEGTEGIVDEAIVDKAHVEEPDANISSVESTPVIESVESNESVVVEKKEVTEVKEVKSRRSKKVTSTDVSSETSVEIPVETPVETTDTIE